MCLSAFLGKKLLVFSHNCLCFSITTYVRSGHSLGGTTTWAYYNIHKIICTSCIQFSGLTRPMFHVFIWLGICCHWKRHTNTETYSNLNDILGKKITRMGWSRCRHITVCVSIVRSLTYNSGILTGLLSSHWFFWLAGMYRVPQIVARSSLANTWHVYSIYNNVSNMLFKKQPCIEIWYWITNIYSVRAS